MDKQTPADTVKEATSAIQDAAQKPMAAAERIAKQAGDTLKSAVDRLRARVPESGMAGTVADIVTGGVKQAATRLEEQGFGGLMEDVVAVARKYPVQTLLLGFGCGYLWARRRRE
jgi:hypothetical protein